MVGRSLCVACDTKYDPKPKPSVILFSIFEYLNMNNSSIWSLQGSPVSLWIKLWFANQFVFRSFPFLRHPAAE